MSGARNDGKALEEEIGRCFPGTKPTSGSGRIWGDGDAVGHGISFEAKDQARVSLDAWWSQTRIQALKFGREPVLVMRRPPAKLEFGKASKHEVLAVVNLSFLAALHERIHELEARESLRDAEPDPFRRD